MNLGLYVEGLVEKEGYEISKKSTVDSIIVRDCKKSNLDNTSEKMRK